jgi:membrane-associated phospholipid phosphatase
MITLPNLVKDRLTKWVFFIVGAACTLVLYQITNRNHLYPPQYLEFGWLDHRMPFWPWTIWIYFTEYVIFFSAYFGLRKKEHITRYWYSYMAILLFSIVVFIFYPVTFPRNLYPTEGITVSEKALDFLRTYMDSPANCLPSLHVSSCFISAFCFWQESKKKSALFFLWSVLVSISTMTTKQHYFIDVWTSFFLCVASYYVFFYRVKIKGAEA